MKVIFALITVAFAFTSYAQSDAAKTKSLKYQHRAWKEFQAHKFETAVLLLDSSIALDSSRPSPFILRSEALWLLGKYAEAANTYEKWIELEVLTDSTILLVGAYVQLGMLYDKANMFTQAKEHYMTAINTFESSYKPLKHFEIVEEMEYVMAFGLLGDSENWQKKLEAFIKKHRSWNLSNLKNLTRKQLLDNRFAPYMLNDR